MDAAFADPRTEGSTRLAQRQQGEKSRRPGRARALPAAPCHLIPEALPSAAAPRSPPSVSRPGPRSVRPELPARSPPPAAARVALPSLKPGYLEARAAEHFTQGPRSQRARCSGSLSFSRSTW